MPVRCAQCGFDNPAGATCCELCAAALGPEASVATGDLPHRVPTGLRPIPVASALSSPRSLLGQVKLVVEQGMIIGEQYLLSEPRMVIGRSDPSSAVYPDIDLTGQDNEYVHRQHALVQFYDLDTRISVEHLGGSNATLINNEPLVAGELVELRIGDRLRVGRVVMRLVEA